MLHAAKTPTPAPEFPHTACPLDAALHETAAAASADEQAVTHHKLATEQHRPHSAGCLQTFIRREVRGMVQRFLRDGARSVGVKEDQVRIEANRNRSLLAQSEQARRGRRKDVDHALERDLAGRSSHGMDHAQQRLDARRPVADLVEGRCREALLHRQPIRHMIGRDQVQPAARQAQPQRVAIRRRAERRRDHGLDHLGLVIGLIGGIGIGQVLGAGLGVDRPAAGSGSQDLGQRIDRGEVHHKDRCVRGACQGDGPMRRLRLGVGWAATCVVAAGHVSRGERLLGEGVDDRGVLAVDLQHPAVARHGPQRIEEALIGQAEVVDHERLGGRHAGLDECGELPYRIPLLAGDDRRERVVDRRLALRAVQELPQATHQRSGSSHADPRAGVVEREEGGRAAVRGGNAVREEALRLVGRGEAGMGVGVDHAREDEQPRCVEGPGPGFGGQLLSDGADPPAFDRDVRDEAALRGDHGATPDQQLSHPACSSLT